MPPFGGCGLSSDPLRSTRLERGAREPMFENGEVSAIVAAVVPHWLLTAVNVMGALLVLAAAS